MDLLIVRSHSWKIKERKNENHEQTRAENRFTEPKIEQSKAKTLYVHKAGVKFKYITPYNATNDN